MQNIYFTPGPAALYPTFEKHIKSFIDRQLGSISHRSQQYRDLHRFTVEQLRTLLSIPTTHQVLFLGSASEAWERILLNCVEHESFHLVNGSFSRKFYDYAQALHKFAHIYEKPMGEGFDAAEIEVPAYAELICTTHNETSAGVQMKPADIHKLKNRHPDKLIAVDMVSSAPYPALDFGLVDTAFFSVQKAFGLPAGLGVWIVNEACLAKAERLRQYDSLTIGAHHDLPTLWKNAEKNETPATPNVMSIYLLGKIAEDLNRIGIETIRKETEQKAAILYNTLKNSSVFDPFVTETRHQSQTVVVANTRKDSSVVISNLKGKGMMVGSGYGPYKGKQIRIANFPATSFEQIDTLARALNEV
ncbi:aminotransferase class V-fold PLP-dependent enzyme [Arundinibacter roseus]|uniref:phosphoserine transaminase n=1 Tax=Arundinibacter roseus TaxID=2070510 RepID=A0A4R4K900_9BACT|nr:aminotransferase class V-fold PLP-dependent enzyme [Arundinibacter roseus]TDB64120.1 aminotransferase class V-fold PLP-dependent enzyme [Arundinibacter roseus]